MANEIHTLNVGNTSYTIQPRVLGPMSTHNTNGAQFSASSVVRYDTLLGEIPFGPNKSTGYNNAVLSISRYSNDRYTSQLGFSGAGIYARWFNDKTPDATTPWRRFIMDDGGEILNIDTPNVNVIGNTLNIDTPNVNVTGNISGGKGRSKINITTDDFTINNSSIKYKALDRITVLMNDMGESRGPYVFTNKKVYYNSSAGNLPNASTSANSLREYYVWINEAELERFMNYDGSTSQQFSIAFTESGNAKDEEDLEVAGHGEFTFIPSENCFIPNEVYTEYYITEYDASDMLNISNIHTYINTYGNRININKHGVDISGKIIDIVGYNTTNIGSTGTSELHLNAMGDIFIGDSESEFNPVLDIAASSINISGGQYTSTDIVLGNVLAADENYAQYVYTYCNIIPRPIGDNAVDIGDINRRFTNIYSLQSYATNGFFQTSDERLKNFGDNIKVDFDALSKLRKAYFTWNDNPDTTHIGVSAQEVRELYPEVVTETDGQLSVDYAKLSVVALAAVDELHKKNVELESRLAKLEAMLLK